MCREQNRRGMRYEINSQHSHHPPFVNASGGQGVTSQKRIVGIAGLSDASCQPKYTTVCPVPVVPPRPPDTRADLTIGQALSDSKPPSCWWSTPSPSLLPESGICIYVEAMAPAPKQYRTESSQAGSSVLLSRKRDHPRQIPKGQVSTEQTCRLAMVQTFNSHSRLAYLEQASAEWEPIAP